MTIGDVAALHIILIAKTETVGIVIARAVDTVTVMVTEMIVVKEMVMVKVRGLEKVTGMVKLTVKVTVLVGESDWIG